MNTFTLTTGNIANADTVVIASIGKATPATHRPGLRH